MFCSTTDFEISKQIFKFPIYLMYYIGLLSNVALTAGQELELRHVGSNVLSGSYVVSLVRGPGVPPKPKDVTPTL
jgi:hypothetical protein